LKAKISIVLIFLATRSVVAQAAAEVNPWKPSGTVYWTANPIRLNLGFAGQNGKPSAAEVRATRRPVCRAASVAVYVQAQAQ
jgi:hypothetical protein